MVLTQAQTARAARLVDAVPWLSTVYAAGDMPRPVARLVRLLDQIIAGDVGRSIAKDSHFSSNGGVLTDP